MIDIEKVKFNEKGLVPAIVQDALTKEVLTLAYMNKESLQKSLQTKETWFYSRSRQELWHKGETSGNTQKIKEIYFDCDQDALLVKVIPNGPACHKGETTCFHETVFHDESFANKTAANYEVLDELQKTIKRREVERPEGAYTTYLFEKGLDKILKKIGEEAAEVIIAAKNRDHEELKWEVADLIYHTLVLLEEQKLPLSEVLSVLNERAKK